MHSPIQTTEALQAKYEAKEVVDEQKNPSYAGMIETLDRNVGRLVAALKENGQMENTILIFFSDNGGSWNGTVNTPLKGAKGTLYEGGIRVPAFLYAPGLYEGAKTYDYPVISSDFYPSFMAWAGLKQREEDVLDGQSLLPLLEGHTLAQKALFWYYPIYLPGGKYSQGHCAFRTTPACALRLGDYKLIRFYGEEHDELYKLTNDIGEQDDLREKEVQKYQELQTLMDQWHLDNNVPIPSETNAKFDGEYANLKYDYIRVR